MAATTPAGGAGALAMMASTIQGITAQAEAEAKGAPLRHAVLPNGKPAGATYKLLSYLKQHGRGTARELGHAAGIEPKLVGALLKFQTHTGHVRVDKTFKPAQYVLLPASERPVSRRRTYAMQLLAQERGQDKPPALAELLEWQPVGSPPDCNRTVLCWGPDGAEMGYFASSQWYTAEGMPIDCFTHWAEPEGPPGFERDTDGGEG